jgi:hypothetical protein
MTEPNTTERILVIANETVASDALAEVIVASAGGGTAEVLAIAPALNSRVRHWLSDEDEARSAAKERLQRCVERLHRAGVSATGWIGDADPLQAFRDALAFFPADTVIVASDSRPRSNWLARDLVERASRYFAGPILHVTVDSGNELAAAA